MTFQKPYREPSATEILSRSLGLYLDKFEYFLVPFLLANIANVALRHIMDYFMPPLNIPQNFTEEFFLWLINYLAAVMPVVAVFMVTIWILNTLANGIAVKYMSDVLEGRHARLREGVRSTFSSVFSLLAAGLVTGTLMTLGLILFIIPGIIIAVIFSLTVQVIIIERLGAPESLRRSRRLVADRWWKTFAVLFSVFLITAVTYALGDIIGSSFERSFSALKWLITITVPSLAQPIHPIALTYLYYSLRTREKPIEPVTPLQARVPVAPPSTRPPTPTFEAFQPRFCYKCGQKLPSDAVYCPRCGVRVRS